MNYSQFVFVNGWHIKKPQRIEYQFVEVFTCTLGGNRTRTPERTGF